MLYPLPYAEAVAVLENTNYLVYDQPVFLQQSETESAEVLSIIDREFQVMATIRVAGREVLIYERIPNA